MWTARHIQMWAHHFDRKKPSLFLYWGFFVGWFPNQEPGGRGPPLKNNLQNWSILGLFSRGDPLPPDSWFGNHPARKHPRGGGFFRSIQSTNLHVRNIDIRARWKKKVRHECAMTPQKELFGSHLSLRHDTFKCDHHDTFKCELTCYSTNLHTGHIHIRARCKTCLSWLLRDFFFFWKSYFFPFSQVGALTLHEAHSCAWCEHPNVTQFRHVWYDCRSCIHVHMFMYTRAHNV